MKPESHRKITEFALNLYLNGVEGGSLAADLNNDRYKEALLDGSEDEDDTSLSRGLNWHFYPANNVIKNDNRKIMLFLTLRPTSSWIVEKRQEKVLDKLEDGASKSIFKHLGRIFHHIQDMSTPTHVVPVYHDYKISDPFETYLCDHWQQIEVKMNEEAASFSALAEESASEDFVALYDNGGRKLLKCLELDQGLFPVTVNNDNIKIPSTAFWQPYAVAPSDIEIPFDINGFGSFGPLGENFGKCNSYVNEGEAIAVDLSVYEKIAVFFMRLAVKDTLTGFKIFENLYNR